LHLADVVVRRELAEDVGQSPELWAACIAGALPETEVLPLLRKAGFSNTRLVERFDCFRGASAQTNVSPDPSVCGATFYATL
jgi:hypothetical protein